MATNRVVTNSGLYCTLCAGELELTLKGGLEANARCPNGHIWHYDLEELAGGDFLVYSLQCDMNGLHYTEVPERLGLEDRNV